MNNIVISFADQFEIKDLLCKVSTIPRVGETIKLTSIDPDYYSLYWKVREVEYNFTTELENNKITIFVEKI